MRLHKGNYAFSVGTN